MINALTYVYELKSRRFTNDVDNNDGDADDDTTTTKTQQNKSVRMYNAINRPLIFIAVSAMASPITDNSNVCLTDCSV